MEHCNSSHSLLKVASENITVLPTLRIRNLCLQPFPMILNYAKAYVDRRKVENTQDIWVSNIFLIKAPHSTWKWSF